jgi:hypothetical protein
MKQILLFSLVSLTLASCDAPQRTRLTPDSLAASNNFSTNLNNPGPGFIQAPNSTVVTSDSTGNLSVLPAGFSGCDISPRYNVFGIGTVGICQSLLDETDILFQVNIGDTSSRTCLIPTYKDQTGSSSYIGQPQCLYTEINKIVQGKLFKNRSGFTQYPLNGVMIMKEVSMPNYFKCMDAYVSYSTPACPAGARTNASCDQLARNYMNQLCTSFKTNTAYLDIKLKP